jgi:hypothetical protein
MRSRQRPISGLWLWGGGNALSVQTTRPKDHTAQETIFADDPYVDGLVNITGTRKAHAEKWSDLLRAASDRTAIVLEAFRLPANSSIATPIQALEAIDGDWVAPAFEATVRGDIQRLLILANDRRLAVSSRDRWKFWRRPRGVFSDR